MRSRGDPAGRPYRVERDEFEFYEFGRRKKE